MTTMKESLETLLESGFKPQSSADQTNPDKRNKPSYRGVESLVITADDENGITVNSACGVDVYKKLASLNTYSLELRRKVRDYFTAKGEDGSCWNLRYASQVHNFNLPFLVNAPKGIILVDLMLPYRNPVKSLSLGESVDLIFLKYHFHYEKSAKDVFAVSSATNLQGRHRSEKSKRFEVSSLESSPDIPSDNAPGKNRS